MGTPEGGAAGTGQDPRGAVESHFQRGMAARRAERPAEALRQMKAAIALARAHDDPVALARALHGRANVERDMGRLDVALRLYREAVPLCRRGADPLALAHTVRHLGDLLGRRASSVRRNPVTRRRWRSTGRIRPPRRST